MIKDAPDDRMAFHRFQEFTLDNEAPARSLLEQFETAADTSIPDNLREGFIFSIAQLMTLDQLPAGDLSAKLSCVPHRVATERDIVDWMARKLERENSKVALEAELRAFYLRLQPKIDALPKE
jgi:hypothetical protein